MSIHYLRSHLGGTGTLNAFLLATEMNQKEDHDFTFTSTQDFTYNCTVPREH